MDNLIDSWLAVELAVPNRTRGDALADINAEFGTRYTHSTLSRWQRGERTPRPDVMRYMAQSAIGRVLREEGVTGLSDQSLDRIADRLTPPRKRV